MLQAASGIPAITDDKTLRLGVIAAKATTGYDVNLSIGPAILDSCRKLASHRLVLYMVDAYHATGKAITFHGLHNLEDHLLLAARRRHDLYSPLV